VPRLRISGAIPLLPLYASVSWARTTTSVYFFHTTKFPLQQATKAQRGSRGKAPFFL